MKRVLAFLLAVCLAVPAAWAAEDGPAEAGSGTPAPEVLAGQLQSLGLFLGNGTGDFDLDRAPTRAEAVVMLVRALGKEEEAKTLPTGHPFTDVPEWADSAVSYAYAQGYTKGISDTLLGAEEPCSAEMYLTFLLRALGYQEGWYQDFYYESPYALANEVGIFLICVDFQDFRRSDVVEATAAALFAKEKESGQPMHLRLEADGVLTPADFSAAFPSDPYAREKQVHEMVDAALEEKFVTPFINATWILAQKSILWQYTEGGGSITALTLYDREELYLIDGEVKGGNNHSGLYELTFDAETGAPLSITEAQLDPLDGSKVRLSILPSGLSMLAYRAASAAAENWQQYSPRNYAQAVEELRSSFGYYNERTFEGEACTIFVYDRGGMMNAHTGLIELIYKPGSAMGEATQIWLPYPRVKVLNVCTPADMMELSEDKSTFTYAYYLDQPLIFDDEIIRGTGIYTYTTDLATGETEETVLPLSYNGAMASLTKNPKYTVERKLEGPSCTAVLRWKDANFAEPVKDYELYLVYQPDSPLADTIRQRLILPSTAAVQGYSNVPTNRVPDTLAFTDDGSALIYTYHFDEALYEYHGDKLYHDVGTYTYTVDLSTGETSVTHTFD